MILKAALAAGALLLTASLAFTATLYVQGRRKPDRTGQYVALGSSFAAGYGLGARAPGSPLACMRSANGYPRELAGLTGLALVDMSCSGSTTEHLLNGGQVFLGPQLDAVGPATKLVTITSGGNDVNYIGDLTLASGSLGLLGKIPKLVWKGPAPLADRDFAKVKKNLREIVVSIKSRAPDAMIVVVSYLPVLPPQGSCQVLGIDDAMASLFRQIASGLLEATRAAAEMADAMFVDMAGIGQGHDACSAQPWVNGKSPDHGAPFHPNAAGTRAIADAVYGRLSVVLTSRIPGR